jgi:leucyl aminopeptidase
MGDHRDGSKAGIALRGHALCGTFPAHHPEGVGACPPPNQALQMSDPLKIAFGPFEAPTEGVLVLFVTEDLEPIGLDDELSSEAGGVIARAARAAKFKPKAGAILDILAPEGVAADRLLVMSVGGAADRAKTDWVKSGGLAMGKLGSGASAVVALNACVEAARAGEAAADFALGMRLRAFRFDAYKTKKKDDEAGAEPGRVTIALDDHAGAAKAYRRREALGRGVETARRLVNEPPNVLTPIEFARRAQALTSLGVEIEVLEPRQLETLGMRALLGVAQGSANPPRVVAMRWNGGKKGAQPLAFIGKGVTFDSGGISIKPGAGMEDMKGDMAGAACVVGLMEALAGRKAKANVVGVVGLVENMPDGAAQRPGDIVRSMSGQTIEIINTDAEGRLVLADLLWHVHTSMKPRFMVNLATLTGAILIALGQENAGLFSNDDGLAEALRLAGDATGETVWRMPMGAAYDKMIDSKFADMKNTGGRHAGSITAAQFLKRYVGETPWAHLDVAGVAMGSPQSDTNAGWASGWGVRLLDRLVSDGYEG